MKLHIHDCAKPIVLHHKNANESDHYVIAIMAEWMPVDMAKAKATEIMVAVNLHERAFSLLRAYTDHIDTLKPGDDPMTWLDNTWLPVVRSLIAAEDEKEGNHAND